MFYILILSSCPFLIWIVPREKEVSFENSKLAKKLKEQNEKNTSAKEVSEYIVKPNNEKIEELENLVQIKKIKLLK